jgi:hypothetical protein
VNQGYLVGKSVQNQVSESVLLAFLYIPNQTALNLASLGTTQDCSLRVRSLSIMLTQK